MVELVDENGAATGSATVEEAHTAPGQLHRAFSVFLRDPAGRVLLQQRAAEKTRFPLRWANTCCGHPLPGEDITVAAARRLGEELRITGVPLAEVGVYSYYAEDPATGRVEYEYDHVLLGDVPAGGVITPDPAEVGDVRWVPLGELVADLSGDLRAYAPWLPGVAKVLLSASDSPSPSGSPSASGSPSPSGSGFVSGSGFASADVFAERSGER